MSPWIEAMRLRTLPASTSGVILAFGYSLMTGTDVRVIPAIICLLFAVLVQIASNFANEYYDFRHGLDRPGREGPRRGVTEGDLTPGAMLKATYVTLAAACIIGLSLVWWGGWWLILAGIFIALGVIAYSAGPYPLSQHGLGEVAVLFFFGVIPVNLTFYVITLQWSITVVVGSVAAGLLAANILIVNNYRDREADKAVGKNTLAVILGPAAMRSLYLLNGLIALFLVFPLWFMMGGVWWIVPVIFVVLHVAIWKQLSSRTGAALNPLLGITACLMLLYCLTFTIVTAILLYLPS